jgi:LPS O-antigen subunit length determinant protein (WzzB/FepE family)
MALEKGTEIYDKIVQYYEFSDRLIREIEESANSEEMNEKAQILLPIAKQIKETADKLIEEYVKYLNKEEAGSAEKIKHLINELIHKVELTKIKVYELYKQGY